jgi:recombination protein RecA
MYGGGISQSGSVLDLGAENKIIEKKGAWFSYEGTLIGQGREAAKRYLVDHPEIMEKIVKAIREKVQVLGGTVLGESARINDE